jgi:hypothetical protein
MGSSGLQRTNQSSARSHEHAHARKTDYYIYTHYSSPQAASPQGGIIASRRHRLKAVSSPQGGIASRRHRLEAGIGTQASTAHRPASSRKDPQGTTHPLISKSGAKGLKTAGGLPWPPHLQPCTYGGGIPLCRRASRHGRHRHPERDAQLQPQGEQRPQGRTTVPRLKRRPSRAEHLRVGHGAT